MKKKLRLNQLKVKSFTTDKGKLKGGITFSANGVCETNEVRICSVGCDYTRYCF